MREQAEIEQALATIRAAARNVKAWGLNDTGHTMAAYTLEWVLGTSGQNVIETLLSGARSLPTPDDEQVSDND